MKKDTYITVSTSTSVFNDTFFYITRKCPLRGHILAPSEELHDRGPGVNLEGQPGGQGVIPR